MPAHSLQPENGASLFAENGNQIRELKIWGDSLYYIHKYSPDSPTGILKRISLVSENPAPELVVDHPLIHQLLLDDDRLVAVSREALLFFDSPKLTNPPETRAVGYHYSFGKGHKGLSVVGSNQLIRERSSMEPQTLLPAPIGIATAGPGILWVSVGAVMDPLNTSREYRKVGGGLLNFQKSSETWQWVFQRHEGRIEGPVSALEWRPEGTLNIGSYEGWLYTYRPVDGELTPLLHGKSDGVHNDIRGITTLGDEMFLITGGSRFVVFNPKKGELSRFEAPYGHDQGRFVRETFEKSTNAWTGPTNQDYETGDFLSFEPPYHCAYEITPVQAGIGAIFPTASGFYLWDRKRNHTIHWCPEETLPTYRVFSAVIHDSDIYLGTDQGLFRISRGLDSLSTI